MFGFGLFLYGPLQYYWYNLLGWLMPVNTTATFLAKVRLMLSWAARTGAGRLNIHEFKSLTHTLHGDVPGPGLFHCILDPSSNALQTSLIPFEMDPLTNAPVADNLPQPAQTPCCQQQRDTLCCQSYPHASPVPTLIFPTFWYIPWLVLTVSFHCPLFVVTHLCALAHPRCPQSFPNSSHCLNTLIHMYTSK